MLSNIKERENSAYWEHEMQTYILDLTTLLQILSRQRQSGVLQAEDVPLPGMKKGVQAHLVLVQGNVQSCTIFLNQGSGLAEGPKALQMLYELGALEWSWTPNSPGRAKETRPVPVVRNPKWEAMVPLRTERAETTALNMLSRSYRRILALVDGSRSVHKIALMLAITDRELLKELRELQASGMIIWNENPSEAE